MISDLCSDIEGVIVIGPRAALGGMKKGGNSAATGGMTIIGTLCYTAGGGMRMGFRRMGSGGSGAACKGRAVAPLRI